MFAWASGGSVKWNSVSSKSEPSPRHPSPGVEGDAYAELLSRTRDLRADHRTQRDAWFAELAVDNKEELLFELEVLRMRSVVSPVPMAK